MAPFPRPRHLVTWLTSFLLAVITTVPAWAYTYADECGPVWHPLPMEYVVDAQGTDQFGELDEVEAIFERSFEAWQTPCCSAFRAHYGGRVDGPSALNDDTIDSVLLFHDDDWPAYLGGPDAVAITMLTVNADCHIDEAPIHFNAAHHQFVDGDHDTGVDLQSIATHEVGHLLGLGHSEYLEATMFSQYIGGTSPRSLHRDDIDGVCALYPAQCPCSTDSDCRDGYECLDDHCTPERCDDDSDCAPDFQCVDGDCAYPPCDDDGDCDPDRLCQNQRCVDPCPACRPCTEHADCGHQGYCRSFPHGGRCFIACGQNRECPGDSVCTDIDMSGEQFSFCTTADPEHPNDYCAADYRCQDFDHDFDPCPGLGNDCDRNNYECSPTNDICVERDDHSLICSCTCVTDADCGRRHHCVSVSDGQSACLPAPDDACPDPPCPDTVDAGDPDHRGASASPSSCAAATRGPTPIMVILSALLVVGWVRRPGLTNDWRANKS